MDQKSFLLHYYVLIIFDVDCYINKKSRTCRRVVDFPGGSVVKNLPASTEAVFLIPGSGRSSGEANENPFQYSSL